MIAESNKKVIAVTGGTGAIGYAICELIAGLQKFEVVILCRDKGKGEKAVLNIVQKTGNNSVRYEIVDVSDKQSIYQLADRWKGGLHGLVNNAAITPKKREETPTGIERQFATNILGYFWMMDAFTWILKENAPSRIVNVASYWAGDLDFSDLEFKKRRYSNSMAYRQSKQGNRMLSKGFSDRLKPFGVFVNACHPGDVESRLSLDLGFGGHESAASGADTPVWLATKPIGVEETGKYFEHKSLRSCSFSSNIDEVNRLMEICGNY